LRRNSPGIPGQEKTMQRDAKLLWRPRSGVPGAVTVLAVVALSAFVQARLLWSELETRKIMIASHASPRVGCVDTSIPVRVDVVADTPAVPMQVVERSRSPNKRPS
jgi:hypothetical protein